MYTLIGKWYGRKYYLFEYCCSSLFLDIQFRKGYWIKSWKHDDDNIKANEYRINWRQREKQTRSIWFVLPILMSFHGKRIEKQKLCISCTRNYKQAMLLILKLLLFRYSTNIQMDYKNICIVKDALKVHTIEYWQMIFGTRW